MKFSLFPSSFFFFLFLFLYVMLGSFVFSSVGCHRATRLLRIKSILHLPIKTSSLCASLNGKQKDQHPLPDLPPSHKTKKKNTIPFTVFF